MGSLLLKFRKRQVKPQITQPYSHFMLISFVLYGGAINLFLQSKIMYKSYIGIIFKKAQNTVL